MSKSLKVFITYSHTDSAEKDKLITCLAVMKREGLISIWHDNEMLGGDKWRDEIFNNLDDSDILLYLVSAKSLESENCNKELTAALSPNIRVIPIILEDCDWKNHQLSEFQALPDKGKPINDINEWNPESKGWQNVVDGIRKVIKGMQSQTRPSPTITPEEIKSLSDSTVQKGNFLMMLKQIDDALKAYSRAIELSPNHTAAFNNRGVAYHGKGKLDLAVKDYNIAIKLNPDDANAYSNRGNVYREMGEFNRAIDDTNTAIKLNPNCTEAYNNRGAAYGEKGDFDLAIKDCSKAIELNPNCTEAYSNRGNAYCIKGKFDLAIGDYNKAIRLNPRFAKSYFNRGVAYCQKGKFDLAIGDYNKVTQMNPSFVRAYYCRAFVWLHLQEWEKAKEDLTIAINMGVDIITSFRNQLSSVVNFEQKYNVKLPEDIVEMLTPP